MNKFKIGQKVKVSNMNPRYEKDHNYNTTIKNGMVGTVEVIDNLGPRNYKVYFDQEKYSYFDENELTLYQPKQYTKSDLKDNHICKERNGDITTGSSIMEDSAYFEDFTYKYDNQFDIIEIYEFENLVWKREEVEILEEPVIKKKIEKIHFEVMPQNGDFIVKNTNERMIIFTNKINEIITRLNEEELGL